MAQKAKKTPENKLFCAQSKRANKLLKMHSYSQFALQSFTDRQVFRERFEIMIPFIQETSCAKSKRGKKLSEHF